LVLSLSDQNLQEEEVDLVVGLPNPSFDVGLVRETAVENLLHMIDVLQVDVGFTVVSSQ
jgi:hypothetical protein